MLTYITAFIFYTLAMIGVLLIGYVIYKKTSLISKNEAQGMIKVLDTLSIAPRKILMVVKIKNEKFLIASGAEHTTFLAKLDEEIKLSKNTAVKEIIERNIAQDKSEIKNFSTEKQNRAADNDAEDNLEESFHKQFRELYSKDEITNEIVNNQRPDRKELIRRLLKDLNETQSK